jgi:hypothetical protein
MGVVSSKIPGTMDQVKDALKNQYHAGLAMLRDCIEKCPDEVWNQRQSARSFWRIAYHTLYFTHMYLGESEHTFVPWDLHVEEHDNLYDAFGKGYYPTDYVPTPYTKQQLLDYCAKVDKLVDESLDAMDLTAEECGFSWYRMPKLNHQLVNLRHIMGHQGQLAEILNELGIDTDWFGGSRSLPSP